MTISYLKINMYTQSTYAYMITLRVSKIQLNIINIIKINSHTQYNSELFSINVTQLNINTFYFIIVLNA